MISMRTKRLNRVLESITLFNINTRTLSMKWEATLFNLIFLIVLRIPSTARLLTYKRMGSLINRPDQLLLI